MVATRQASPPKTSILQHENSPTPPLRLDILEATPEAAPSPPMRVNPKVDLWQISLLKIQYFECTLNLVDPFEAYQTHALNN